MEATTSEGNRVDLERRNAELESRLGEAREQLDAVRERLDRLAAEQADALAALHKAERRRGSLAYRLAAEVRARLGRSR
jgi:uncharacterized membrane protein